MPLSLRPIRVSVFTAALALASCGGSSNFNFNKVIFVDQEDAERFDVLMTEARLAYDGSRYFEAQRAAEKAYAISPNSESAAQLLGFVYLARAGIDIFTLIKKMDELGGKNTSATSGSLDVLAQLAPLIELKESDLA